ncbi:hypothetical protein [Paenibacillus sp.]|uniref:hypothetical protein n=1 Tax=Paenibacillus sp. TaxID=58172 RepID=UPI00283125DD|nr:hypothetical protein [Paenibacillus sp.]MDR0269609.1 hypothetical protein [Paenibacillus sp.]
MLTATEIINYSNKLSMSRARTIDQFFINLYGTGIDLDDPFFAELRDTLNAIMVLEEVNDPNGYTYYEWIDR